MTLTDLIKRTGQAEPYAKYVLLRLVFRTWDGVSIGGASKDLVASFGITYSQFVGAKTALLEAGLLCEEVVKTADASKPSRKLVWSLQCPSDTVSSLVSCVNHAHAVNAVLNLRTRVNKTCAINPPEVVNKGKQLAQARAVQPITAINCLLLAVLWLLADKFGVVEKVGAKELAALTGLDRDSVKYRVQKLSQLGFLRLVVQGGYSKMLGGRVRTTYVLNAQSPIFSQTPELPQCFDMQKLEAKNCGFDNWLWSEAEHKWRVESWLRERSVFFDSEWDRYHWVLENTEDEVYFRHLALKLSSCAGLVLAKKMEQSVVTSALIDELIHQEILRDFHAPRKSDGSLWARYQKKLKHLRDQAEPVMELDYKRVRVEGESNARVKHIEGDQIPVCGDLLYVMSEYVRKMVRLVEQHHLQQPLVDWSRSRLIWFPCEAGERGFMVLSSTG